MHLVEESKMDERNVMKLKEKTFITIFKFQFNNNKIELFHSSS